MAIKQLESPIFKSVKADGSPNSLGTVGVYETGTSFATPVTIWDTQTKDATLTNPVTLNSAGEKEIWFDGVVDIQVKDFDGNVIPNGQILNVSSSPTATVTGNYNLIQNGSFEIDSDSDGAPDSWTLSPDSGGTIAIDSTSGGQVHGANGLKFTGTGSGGGSATSTKFDVLAGSDLITEFSYKSSAATSTNTVVINWYKFDDSASATSPTTVHSLAIGNPSSWTVYSYIDSVPSDAVKAEIVITGVDSGGTDKTGPTWFDNISVIAKATEYTTTLSSAASAVSISSMDFPADKEIEVEILLIGDAGATILDTYLEFNGDTTQTNYYIAYTANGGAVTQANSSDIGGNIGAGTTLSVKLNIIPDSVTGTVSCTYLLATGNGTATPANISITTGALNWLNGSAITSISIRDPAAGGTIATGSRMIVRLAN
jgi:hypothetical protein